MSHPSIQGSLDAAHHDPEAGPCGHCRRAGCNPASCRCLCHLILVANDPGPVPLIVEPDGPLDSWELPGDRERAAIVEEDAAEGEQYEREQATEQEHCPSCRQPADAWENGWLAGAEAVTGALRQVEEDRAAGGAA